MLSAAVLRRVLYHATIFLLFLHVSRSLDTPTCILTSQLSSATAVVGGSLTTVVPSGCVLRNSTADLLTITSNTKVSGGANRTGTLDTQFAANAVNASGPGFLLTLDSLSLLNVLVETTPFLQLAAFSAVKLQLSHVVIATDCQTWQALANASRSVADINPTIGTGYLYIDAYSSSTIKAEDVNVTCRMPQISWDAGGEFTEVADSLQLRNALVASQLPPSAGGPQANLTIRLVSNITLSPALWGPARPLVVAHNVTLQGSPGATTVLDLQAVVNAVVLEPGTGVELDYVVILNAGPLRGATGDLSLLPLFSVPIWFFSFVRGDGTLPQVTMVNATIPLTPTEFAYFVLWTLVLTGPMAHLSEMAASLRATTPVIKLADSTNVTLTYTQLRGTGLDMYNVTLAALPPPVDHTVAVLDNPGLRFELTLTPNITHLPVYNLADLMTVLRLLETSPPPYRTALYLLTNITVDPSVWPAAGYRLSEPVMLVGSNNIGIGTWVDFRQVPVFIRTVGCSPDMYVYVQGVLLLNLPIAGIVVAGAGGGGGAGQQVLQAAATGLGVAAGSVAAAGAAVPQAGGGPAAAAAAGDEAVRTTMFVTNILGETKTCAAPTLYLNQSSLVVPYADYKLVRAMVAPYLGSDKQGVEALLGSNVSFNLSGAVSNNITFENVRGWGWSGYLTSISFVFPPGVPELYLNVYDPPGALIPPPSGDSPPGGPFVGKEDPRSSSSSSASLEGWQVALIVVGAVVVVAAITGLIAWRVVTKLRHEVEAVKSAASDNKKSSSASGDHEAANGGARLGSSAMAGGGSQPGNGAPPAAASGGAPAAPGKGGGSQGAGGGGGGGTSDDSTAPAFDRPPLEVLNGMMAALTAEMDDRHLTILEVIGQGGFGVVYKGMWKGLLVAVKTITFQDRVAGGEKAQHRAILEAAISSSLAHPNVVTTYSYDIKPLTVQITANGDGSSGSGQNGGSSPRNGGGGGLKIIDKRPVLDWKLYLIQEFCDGGSLRTAILKRKFYDAKKGEPRMEMILDTCLELVGGLVHLHERNIIHGDLNPNNVLLKRDSSKKYGAVCKIADFGLSIKMNADQSHISNMRRGTPFYTCPQILARGNMTKAADVYSMGVMMWEMFHCCMSYRSLPTGFQARENFPNFPRKAAAEFARVVGACLDSEPARRPSFVALKVELEAQLALLKRGELRSAEELLGPDPAGDAAHLAACQD